jgi:hypothetical protein
MTRYNQIVLMTVLAAWLLPDVALAQTALFLGDQSAPCSVIPNQTSCVAQMCTWNSGTSTCSGTTGATQTIYIGLVEVVNDGQCTGPGSCTDHFDQHSECVALGGCTWIPYSGRRFVACFDEIPYPGGTGRPATNDTWTGLDDCTRPTSTCRTQGFPSLRTSFLIHGDAAGATYGNADTMIVTPTGTSPPSSSICSNNIYNGVMVGTWNAPDVTAYGGSFVHFLGEFGNDTLSNWLATDTRIWGGVGDDRITNWQPSGLIFGEDGADSLCSRGGSGDWIEGGNGADCIWDLTGTALNMSCGGPIIPADFLYNSGGTFGDWSNDHTCEARGTSIGCGC